MTTRFGRLVAAALMLAATPASSGTYELGALVLDTPWVRATPPGAEVAGGYVTITNTGEHAARLVGGEASFAGRVEIHEMTMADGVMRMRPLADGLVVPPGETVPLEPGGYHVMFMELVEPLIAGETVRATLTFADAGAIELPLTVAPMGASEPPVE
jgi:hypothetical protein